MLATNSGYINIHWTNSQNMQGPNHLPDEDANSMVGAMHLPIVFIYISDKIWFVNYSLLIIQILY